MQKLQQSKSVVEVAKEKIIGNVEGQNKINKLSNTKKKNNRKNNEKCENSKVLKK